jgi:hypothetical protein
MASYEQALQRLYQVPVANFLAERKRLVAELRAQGDEAGAAQIAKRPKPVASVWVVNQLYWRARDAFDEMLAAASRVRAGDLRATKAHHDALAALRKRAAGMLDDAGYAASDATLRRVTTTLAAIAAAGSFAPDPPGALATDRDPPGFDAIGVPPQPIGELSTGSDSTSTRAAQAQSRAAEMAERRQRDAERARRKAERSRLQAALRTATAEVRRREHARAVLEKQLSAADKAVADAREMMQDLELQLAALGDAD